MLELPNFGHMTTSTMQFDYVMNINYGVIVFILKYFYHNKG